MNTQKIFVVGLSKTGTSSLKKALELLGYNIRGCMTLQPLKNLLDDKSKIDMYIKKFDGAKDFPWSILYEELYNLYPDSKFILTIRNREDWFDSVKRWSQHCGYKAIYSDKLIYCDKLNLDGSNYNELKDEFINYYNNHNRNVINFFKSKKNSQLLIMHLEKDFKWNKLCEFLGLKIPNINFPKCNVNRTFPKKV